MSEAPTVHRESSEVVPRPRSSTWVGVILAAIPLGLLVGFAALYAYGYPFRKLRDWQDTAQSRLEQVKLQPPEGVSDEKWDFMIGWTQQAIPNCFFVPDYIVDEQRYRRFVVELGRKLAGDVDVDTLNWIWDEIEVMTKNGKEYSATFRPTTPENLRAAGFDP